MSAELDSRLLSHRGKVNFLAMRHENDGGEGKQKTPEVSGHCFTLGLWVIKNYKEFNF